MLRHVGKVATGAVPAAALARLGMPAVGTVIFLAVLAAGVTCWLLSSRQFAAGRPRHARLGRVAGTPGCGSARPSAAMSRTWLTTAATGFSAWPARGGRNLPCVSHLGVVGPSGEVC